VRYSVRYSRVGKRFHRRDALTKLETFRLVDPALRRMRRRYGPHNVSLVLFDIGPLHRVNDRYGMRVGNAVILHLVASMAAEQPPESRGFRVGGDDFALAMPNDGQQAQAIAERIRTRFAETPIPTSEGSEGLDGPTVSAGIGQTFTEAVYWLGVAKGQGGGIRRR
jgi:diguanylate cyclase (GGDEF)-like protein